MKVRQIRTGQEARVIRHPEGIDPFWMVKTDQGLQWWLPCDFELMPEDLDELEADYDLLKSGNPDEIELIQKGWSIAHQQQMERKDFAAG